MRELSNAIRPSAATCSNPSPVGRNGIDDQRRVVRNAYGPLSHPESSPDWSLLR